MEQNVLLINDMCGYGKVALAAMLPVLSHMGFRLHNLPTALVSDSLNYPEFYIQDTTEYVRQTLSIWERLGFRFDAISTGFIQTEEESRVIHDFCVRQEARGVRIFVDPIMADNGRLYSGIPTSRIALMRGLVAVADCTVPNYTEACLLAGCPVDLERPLERGVAYALVDDLRAIGARSVTITSCLVRGAGGDPVHAVVGYDVASDEHFVLPYDQVPVSFPGTGDIFSSVLMGRVLRGDALRTATSKAMNVVRDLILRNQDQPDKRNGLPIEANLDLIDNS